MPQLFAVYLHTSRVDGGVPQWTINGAADIRVKGQRARDWRFRLPQHGQQFPDAGVRHVRLYRQRSRSAGQSHPPAGRQTLPAPFDGGSIQIHAIRIRSAGGRHRNSGDGFGRQIGGVNGEFGGWLTHRPAYSQL